jgi:hypothetical protein
MSDSGRENSLQELRKLHKLNKIARQSDSEHQSRKSNQDSLDAQANPQAGHSPLHKSLSPTPSSPKPAGQNQNRINPENLHQDIDCNQELVEKNALLQELATLSYQKNTKEVAEKRGLLLARISSLTNKIKAKKAESQEKEAIVQKIAELSKQMTSNDYQKEKNDLLKQIALLNEKVQKSSNPEEKKELMRKIVQLSDKMGSKGVYWGQQNSNIEKLNEELMSNIANLSTKVQDLDRYKSFKKPEKFNPGHDPFLGHSKLVPDDSIDESKFRGHQGVPKQIRNVNKHIQQLDTREIMQ